MRVVIYAISPDLEAVYTAAALSTAFEPVAASSLPDLSSLLYRDPQAMGIFWAFGAISAAETVLRIRQGNVENRIIVLLNEVEPPHIVARYNALVLMAGADDVQPADIDHRELSARLLAISSRGVAPHVKPVAFLDCVLDEGAGTVNSPRGTVQLTRRETSVLAHLGRHPHTVQSKQAIIASMCNGPEVDRPGEKVIDVFICNLRRKLAELTDGFEVIETVWGQGYRFTPEGFRPDPAIYRGSDRARREVAS